MSSLHSHDRGHLVYPARGVLSVHTEHGTSIVPASRVGWTPSGFTHYHRAHGHADMRIVFLPASLARRLPGHPGVFLVSDLAREVLLTLTGPRNYEHDERRYGRAAIARLRRVLVDELDEAHEQPLQLPEPRDDRLRAIARMLYERPADNTSLAQLGRSIGASPRTLSRLFHDELGMTFYEWRTQLRVYHALILLAEGYDTTHVAYACGWANPSGFIAAFANVIGTTPGRYRSARPADRSAGRGALAEHRREHERDQQDRRLDRQRAPDARGRRSASDAGDDRAPVVAGERQGNAERRGLGDDQDAVTAVQQR
jgi:AraC-like DNA-binding protein